MTERQDDETRARLDEIQADYESFALRTLRILRFVAVVLVIGGLVSIYLWNENSKRVDEINAEALERRDQNCQLFEQENVRDVERLESTYAFLKRLEPDEFDTSLTRAILAQLPTTEREARLDNAPAYCDEKGVGLPEPDPEIPKRPKFLREPIQSGD